MKNFKSGKMDKKQRKEHKQARANRKQGRGKVWTATAA